MVKYYSILNGNTSKRIMFNKKTDIQNVFMKQDGGKRHLF